MTVGSVVRGAALSSGANGAVLPSAKLSSVAPGESASASARTVASSRNQKPRVLGETSTSTTTRRARPVLIDTAAVAPMNAKTDNPRHQLDACRQPSSTTHVTPTAIASSKMGTDSTLTTAAYRASPPAPSVACGPTSRLFHVSGGPTFMGSSEDQLMIDLTPKQIVARLDEHIVGQQDAKRAVAVAVRNRWRRQQLAPEVARDVYPKNILMIGPTGVGKTEIARRLAKLVDAPFVKVEATKFTEVGYHGRDVEGMIRDLLEVAIQMVSSEQTQSIRDQADAAAEEKLLDLLLPRPYGYTPGAGSSAGAETGEPDDAVASYDRTRERMRQKLRAGELEEQTVEVSSEHKPDVANMFGSAGMELTPDMMSMFDRMIPKHRETKRLPIREARKFLASQSAETLVDKDEILRLALEKTEQSGIVFLDEIDKIAGSGKSDGPDVSRQGVQRDLLPIVEGSVVTTKHGPVRTDHILFIAAGAFHSADPDDLMAELQGRFPIRVELSPLSKEDLMRILKEPRHSLIHQQIELLATEDVKLTFLPDAIDAIAGVAFEVNRKKQDIGARRLHTIIERVLEEASFEASEQRGESLTIDGTYVKRRLRGVIEDKLINRA
jgi:ATP-dependent HslUV protease ATP-binding subunit HslU